MKKVLLLSILFLFGLLQLSWAQGKPAYRLFTKKGKPVAYSKMLKALQEADVVLFGEQHNDPIAHWLQLEVAKDLHQQHQGTMAIGAEMFEADVQLVLNEFLADQLPESTLKEEARPWPNFKTDYLPVLQFAKQNGIPFIATNVPRRYARMVSRGSLSALDSLSQEAKDYMAPLPIEVNMELPGYKHMLTMFGGNTHGTATSTYIVEAQALKDATMAHFISKQAAQGKRVLHLNGAYHSDNFEGIGWYLKQEQPNMEVLTITTVLQDDLMRLKNGNCGKADYILVVPKSMTKTY
ncbi:ChaN family lipoprotein [Pontibacter sp. CAU 1760]